MKLFPSSPHPTSPQHRHFATLLAAYSTHDAADAAVSNLRSAADAMIASGNAEDCEAIYKVARRSAVDESLRKAGFVAMSGHQLHRLEWEQLDRRIKLWLATAAAAFRSTFPAERSLADAVFDADRALADSCYAAAVGAAAASLISFPELVASRSKKSPERMFRFLDMYDLLADLPPPTSAAAAKAKVGEAVRATLLEFESAIQHDADKAAVPGGGLHPATRYVMNYVAFLADYAGALTEILGGVGGGLPPLPVSVGALISDGTEVSLRLSWVILVLLCKVDSKAELYSDVGLSYLFLCNNLHYVVDKVRSGAGLRRLLGEEWLAGHEEKVQIYAANYQRIVWGPVAAAAAAELPPAASLEEVLGRFNGEFEGACRRQRGWVVAERKLRDEIKVSAARAVVPPYRELYRRHRWAAGAAVRFSPEDLGNHFSDLFMRDSPPVAHDEVSPKIWGGGMNEWN